MDDIRSHVASTGRWPDGQRQTGTEVRRRKGRYKETCSWEDHDGMQTAKWRGLGSRHDGRSNGRRKQIWKDDGNRKQRETHTERQRDMGRRSEPGKEYAMHGEKLPSTGCIV